MVNVAMDNSAVPQAIRKHCAAVGLDDPACLPAALCELLEPSFSFFWLAEVTLVVNH